MAHCRVPFIPYNERLNYTLGEGSALAGPSVSKLYDDIARGKLRTIKVGGRRLIPRQALLDYIAGAGRELPPALATSPEKALGRSQHRPRGRQQTKTVAP